ncbi:structural maintenance of chromosomes protein 6 [Skeletonema marinoi]|uniref:Structural maintenance of chromosomes protein 6 n=1 Tax=Skeletonema marinoi TaxID=267567 RepID=A0AAD8YFU7_9STRA|nr:structural maintenance of chromosomes protein 6 [Skeletonema marinoi]
MDIDEIDDGRKKGRRKNHRDDDDYEDKEDDDGDDYNDDDNISSPPPNKKKKKSSSADNTADQHSPMNDRHINPTGKPAEAGIIQEVYVENFMCHRKLSVKLCRNVNFIHGQNGSGKSAILAAIQVCLGAGARRTHRARNLKDLVRKEAGADCSGAKLRVTLLNKGSDGFMPEVYGDTITVERCISMRSGGFNGYKLLDQNGKEQSRRKADLDAMLDQLNIQVENPVAVLDQEEAKKFLTGKAEDKYAFFTKATELERLDRCYANINDNIMEQNDVKQRAREGIQGAIDNTRQLQREWEQFQEIDRLEVDLQRCRADGSWAVYQEMQEKLDVDMREATKFSRSLEKRRAELINYEGKLNVTDDEEIAFKNQLEELTEEARVAAEAKRKLEQDLKIAENPIKAKERDMKILRTEIKNSQKKLTSARRRLDQARNDILESQGNAAEEERTRTRKIAETETDLARAKERVAPLKEQVYKLLREYEDLEGPKNTAEEAHNGTERQLNAVKNKIRSLQSEAGGGNKSLAMFGPKCGPLYELVQRNLRRFKGPVAGPVGMYLKIVNGKEKYAKIAEFAIGNGNLDRFIVTNQDDLNFMERLRREVGCGHRDCSLYKISPRSTQEKYNTPAPPNGVETVTSVVSVDNAMVFNFLVDSCKIDESALADSKEDSEDKLLNKEGNGKRSIRGKVKKVFCLPSGDFWQVNKGLLNITSNDRPLKQTIGVDRSAAIDSAKHELKAIQKELDRNEREVKAIKDQSKRAKVEWNQRNREFASLTGNVTKMEQLLEELKDQAETSEEVPQSTRRSLKMTLPLLKKR